MSGECRTVRNIFFNVVVQREPRGISRDCRGYRFACLVRSLRTDETAWHRASAIFAAADRRRSARPRLTGFGDAVATPCGASLTWRTSSTFVFRFYQDYLTDRSCIAQCTGVIFDDSSSCFPDADISIAIFRRKRLAVLPSYFLLLRIAFFSNIKDSVTLSFCFLDLVSRCITAFRRLSVADFSVVRVFQIDNESPSYSIADFDTGFSFRSERVAVVVHDNLRLSQYSRNTFSSSRHGL